MAGDGGYGGNGSVYWSIHHRAAGGPEQLRNKRNLASPDAEHWIDLGVPGKVPAKMGSEINGHDPTAAADIAAALIVIAGYIEKGEAKWGTYHFAGDEAVSWHGFAEAIVDLAGPRLATHPRVEPITTAQYPTPAQRPMNSVLDCGKITETFGISSSPWRRSLPAVIRELVEQAFPT